RLENVLDDDRANAPPGEDRMLDVHRSRALSERRPMHEPLPRVPILPILRRVEAQLQFEVRQAHAAEDDGRAGEAVATPLVPAAGRARAFDRRKAGRALAGEHHVIARLIEEVDAHAGAPMWIATPSRMRASSSTMHSACSRGLSLAV